MTTSPQLISSLSRCLSADQTPKVLLPIGFRLEGSIAHSAKEVKVASSHNNWQKLTMNRDGKNFILNLELTPGSV